MLPFRALGRAALSWMLSILIVMVSAAVPASAVSSASSALSAAAAVPAAASPDNRIDLSVSASPSTITTPGTKVTWTYTVTNSAGQPAYQRSMTDTACGPITGQSGLQTDGIRYWIPANSTATYTCTSNVDATRTGTATAAFTTLAADGARTTSEATATSTVTLNGACSDIWYSGKPDSGINATTGAIGNVVAGADGLKPKLWATEIEPYKSKNQYDHIRALGVDPRTQKLYYISSKTLTSNNDGLFRIDADGTNNIQIIGPSDATHTDRLTVAPDGAVWSWDENNDLYRLPAGGKSWELIGKPAGPWAWTYAERGDLAFDGAGNLWLLGTDVWGVHQLSVIPASDLTPLKEPRPATLIEVKPSKTRWYGGIAFGPDGRLYAGMIPPAGGDNIVDVIEIATGVGKPFAGGEANVGSRLVDLASCALPKGDLIVSKTAQTANPAVKDGDVIKYTVTVRNVGAAAAVQAALKDAVPADTTYVPGSTTLNGAQVPDVRGMPFQAGSPIEGAATTVDGLIPGGDTATIIFQAKVNAGTVAKGVKTITNQATVTSSAGTVSSDDPSYPTGTNEKADPTLTPVDQTKVALTKTASVDRVEGKGNVTYTYTLTNPGGDALENVTLGDAATTTKSGAAAPLPNHACAAPTRTGGDTNSNNLLEPSETWTYTCEQPLAFTAGDTNPTTITNKATVTARGGVTRSNVTATASKSVEVVPTPYAPQVVKTAGALSSPDATTGEYTATYTVRVSNPSQLAGSYGPLLDTPAFDPTLKVLGASWNGQQTGSADGTGPFTLAPSGTALPAGGSHTYTVTVRFAPTTLQRATACNNTPGKGLHNTASLPEGQEKSSTEDNSACLAPPPAPVTGLTLEKKAGTPLDADGDGVIDAGDTLAYTFTVTNTSPALALRDVKLTDPALTAQGVTLTCPSPLAAGARATCTASKPYVLTQADLDAGSVTNTATATATAPHLPTVASEPSSTTVPLLRVPTLGLVKRVEKVEDVNQDGVIDPGDTIRYGFTVTNRGNVTLDGVTVTDPKLSSTPLTCAAGTLAPGTSTTCTSGPYVITRADQDAGSVANTATANATSNQGPAPTVTSTTSTPVAPIGKLVVKKSAGSVSAIDPATGQASVGYTVTVSNVGGSPIRYGALSDTPSFASQLTIDRATWTGPSSGNATGAGPYTLSSGSYLGPGASHTYAVRVTFHYTTTSPATACGAAPGTGLYNAVTLAKADTSDPDVDARAGAVCATPPAPPTTGLTLDKKVISVIDNDRNNRTSVGDTISYRFQVTNTGSTTLSSISIADPKLSSANIGITCPTTTLSPGGTTTCTSGDYTVSGGDLADGAVTNSATVSGNPPNLTPVTSQASTTTTPVSSAAIKLVKEASAITDGDNNGHDAGDTIDYTFTVTNNGTTALSNVTVSDPRLSPGAPACTIASLAAGTTANCPAVTYTLTQSDVDAGQVRNEARVTGTAADGGLAPQHTDSTKTPITPRAATLNLVKTAGDITDANDDHKEDAGDTITYTFLVTNTGAQTVQNVRIADTKLGVTSLACGAGSLAPGAQTSCSATYTLTQADVDSPDVRNTATATATTPIGATVSADSAQVVTKLHAESRIALHKMGPARVTGAKAGDTLTYTFKVTNTGSTTLTQVAVADPAVTNVRCPDTVLMPNQSTTCSGDAYVLTQADVDAGSRTNTATVSALDPSNENVTSSDTVSTELAGVSEITLDKKTVANGTNTVTDTDGNGTDLGDTIRYAFTVKNTGTTTVQPVTITDPTLGVNKAVCASTLAPGQEATCEFEPYRLTQPDVDFNSVTNTATAEGTTLRGAPVVSKPASVTVEYDPPVAAAAFALDKVPGEVADANGNGRQDAGDSVSYTFNVTNTGPLTIHGLRISDPLLGSSFACGTKSIGPGQSLNCTSPTPYTLTQADIDRGLVTNTATVTGLDPKNRPVPATEPSHPTDTAVVTLAPSAGVELIKTVTPITDLDGNGPDAGDTVNYTFEVRNTGALTLAPLTITDTKLGLSDAPCAPSLAPGASAVCSTKATYTLKQSDVDTRRLENTATVTGLDPKSKKVQADASAGVDIANVGAISLDKRGSDVTDLDDNGPDAGDQISYSFTVKNISNVTLTDIALTDPHLGGVTCKATSLAPGASTTCTANPYTLTQANVDAGRVDNAASVSARAPGGAMAVATDTDTVTFTARAGVAITKKVTARGDSNSNGATDAGDVLTYTISVRNSGAVTVTSFLVSDPLLSNISCETGPISPGASKTCTGTYTVTLEDQRAGKRDNTATVQATAAGNRPLAKDATVSTPVATVANLDVVKTAGTVTAVDPITGQGSATYTVKVVNSGGTPADYTLTDTPAFASNIVIDSATWSGPTSGSAQTTGPWTLARSVVPGESTHEYAVTVLFHYSDTTTAGADGLKNTVALAQDQEQGPTSNNTATPAPPAAPRPGITLSKSVASTTDPDGNGRASAGDAITYTLNVRNTGTTQLTGITVTDEMLGTVTCPATTLAPGASTTCSAHPHVISQAEQTAGAVTNTATATGTPPTTVAGGAAVTDDAASTKPLSTADITVTKTHGTVVDANGSKRVDAGDSVTYTFTVRNSGSVPLRNVTITDPKLSVRALSCVPGTLAPGASATCQNQPAPYLLTQADIDAGTVTNTATATGTPTDDGAAPTGTTSDTLNLGTLESALSLVKTSGGIADVNNSGGVDAGDRITYTFTLKNTGATTVYAPTITDSRITAEAFRCGDARLAPGATTSCTADYTLTQGDVDAKAVTNTATASAKAASATGPSVTSEASRVATPIEAVTALTLDKTAGAVTDANSNRRQDAGDTIAYTFTVTNTGATTLTRYTVSDPRLSATEQQSLTGCQQELAPKAQATCTATHTLTQAEIDAGSVTNAASVSVAGANPPQTATDSVTTELTPTSGISVTGGLGTVPADPVAGTRVPVTITVENTGSTTMTDINVTDSTLGLNGYVCSPGPLAPAASITCTLPDYVLTQADIDAGTVTANPIVSGTPATGERVQTTLSTSATITPAAPAVKLAKESGGLTDANSNGYADVGENVTYTFTVTNTGPVTLTTVTITDRLLSNDSFTCATNLAPGATATCPGPRSYPLTQADLETGTLTNSATATATDTKNRKAEASATTTVPLAVTNSLTLAKSSTGVNDSNGNGRADAGEVVPYTFTVTNTGQQTLTNVVINDAALGVKGVVCVQSLAPGASATCTTGATSGMASRTLTQADIDAGRVTNTATATATTRAGSQKSDSDAETVELTRVAALKVTSAVTSPQNPKAGDTVTITVTVTNTGNTTVNGLSGTTTLPDGRTVTCTPNPTQLAPGENAICTINYVLTQGDVDAGHADLSTTITGTDPNGDVQTGTTSTNVTFTSTSALALDKTAGAVQDADGSTTHSAGDMVPYTFTVTNTGTTSLSGVTITDAALGLTGYACGKGVLAPGKSATCGPITGAITQADLDAGKVVNTATATATNPSTGAAVDSEPETVETLLHPTAAFTLVKQSSAIADTNGSGRADPGDQITYTFTVKNTGAQTLKSVTVTDTKLGVSQECAATLAPGASATCSAPAYRLTQNDVDAGSVTNTATASATPATGGAPISFTSNGSTPSTTTPIEALAALTLSKRAGAIIDKGAAGHSAGDTVSYSFTVTNTSNVTLNSITVTDPLLTGGVSCQASTLAPKASTTCSSSTLSITQAQVDARRIDNTATVTGTTPQNAQVTATGFARVDLAPQIAMTLAKAATCDVGAAGDTGRCDLNDPIEYAFTVTNTGSASLDSVQVDDPTLSLVDFVCGSGPLAVGATRTCTSPVTPRVTQQHLDAGTLSNTATATATSGANTTSAPATATLTFDAPAGVSLTKSMRTITDKDNNQAYSAGDEVSYTFTVTNTGKRTLRTATIRDVKLRLTDFRCATDLAPGASASCSSPAYTITQADINAGSLTNEATVQASLPTSGQTSGSGSATIPLTDFPPLRLTKTATLTKDLNGDGVAGLGDELSYSFTVSNTGPKPVTNPHVGDEMLSARGIAVTCPIGVLASGNTVSCAAPKPLVITQADLANPTLENTATARAWTGEDEQFLTLPALAQSSTPLGYGRLSLTKTAVLQRDGMHPGVADEGDVVFFTFIVANPGTVPVTGVSIADQALAEANVAITCPTDTVKPGGSVTCTSADYTVTAADIAGGVLKNTAAAHGSAASQPVTSPAATSTSSAGTTAQPRLSIDKFARRAAERVNTALVAGEQVTYSFRVTNTGNVTINDVKVTDSLLGEDAVTCEASSLKPGKQTTCSAEVYTVTAQDVQRTYVLNSATATGAPAQGPQVQATAADTVRIPAEDTGLKVTKTAELTKDSGFPGLADPGDEITYRFLITNTSSAPATVRVNDPMLAAAKVDITCERGSLEPQESTTCTASPYPVPADQAQGQGVTTLANLAYATSTTDGGNDASGSDGAVTPVAPKPEASLGLGMGYTPVDSNGNGQLDVGEGVIFDYVVTNTGNVPLENVGVSDPRLQQAGIGITCNDTTLAPGAHTSCQANGAYTVTADDISAGYIISTGTAVGTSQYTGLASPKPQVETIRVPLKAGVTAPGGGTPGAPVPPTPSGPSNPTDDPTGPITPTPGPSSPVPGPTVIPIPHPNAPKPTSPRPPKRPSPTKTPKPTPKPNAPRPPGAPKPTSGTHSHPHSHKGPNSAPAPWGPKPGWTPGSHHSASNPGGWPWRPGAAQSGGETPRKGKGYPVCVGDCSRTREQGYTQANDPNWQAGPGYEQGVGAAGDAQRAGTYGQCLDPARRADSSNGTAVPQLPLLLFSSLAALGLIAGLWRRSRDEDEEDEPGISAA
ncbi:DUF7507 domain-containing protein [Gephyromycinifex aptenodytis]|uniref:DUF7507 domain-containing protein n=1 Tax=Gephyromycinifex aptenodytis TaxID=2716227 RepID=UPI0014464A44|nr:DUF11 domain-containing protein [Gephyromycinifex aptenodytis]